MFSFFIFGFVAFHQRQRFGQKVFVRWRLVASWGSSASRESTGFGVVQPLHPAARKHPAQLKDGFVQII